MKYFSVLNWQATSSKRGRRVHSLHGPDFADVVRRLVQELHDVGKSPEFGKVV